MKFDAMFLAKKAKLQSLRAFTKGRISNILQCKFYATESRAQSEGFSSSSDSDERTESEFCESTERIVKEKERILNAALNFVPHYGWSRQSLAVGAQSIGLPGIAHGIFLREGFDLVNHFYIKCNERLAENLSKESLPKDSRRTAAINYIQNALEQRLRMVIPYIDTWYQAMSLMIIPANIPDATKNLYTLVDDVCYYAGDRSANFSWYTKRAAIAAVYTTTELVLIQDKSEDFHETWTFLSRRISQLSDADECYKQSEAIIAGLPGFVESSFLIVQNILGLRHITSVRQH